MSKILQTPSIHSIKAFDPTFDKYVYYTYVDNQATKNRAIIIDNESNVVVYDKTQDTMRSYHIIPANTLQSGHQYLIQIQVFDVDGNSSNLSDATLMYCYTTPSFYFSNIVDGQEYKNASIELELLYEQPEGEEIRNFQLFKYSYDKTLIEQSDVYYSSSTLKYMFNELKNNTTYYFKAIGETNHGMILDTGYIGVNVSYYTVPTNIVILLENNRHEGYITLKTNIVDIGYTLENDNYVFDNGMLTLSDNVLTYNSGFELDGNFSLFIEAKSLPLQKFFTTSNDTFSLEIIKIGEKYYCRLNVKDTDIVQYSVLSKAVRASDEVINMSNDGDLLIIEVKRINGVYGLNTYYKINTEN